MNYKLKGGIFLVKGVNKTVIEVNNTGSKIFDRIVFYVSPDCGNLSVKNLNKAIKDFTFDFDNRAGKGYTSLRKRIKIKRRIIIMLSAAVFLAVAGAALAVIL